MSKYSELLKNPPVLTVVTNAREVIINLVSCMCDADAGQVAPPDAKHLLPAVLLDDEGYPTEEWLQYIKTYKPDQSLPLLTFVEMVLVDGWCMSDWGFKLHKKYKGKRKLELHTGGWSGNEETIAAIIVGIAKPIHCVYELFK